MSVLGMGRFLDLLGASAKKVNDAMHRFKKSASDTSWHFYRDGSFLTYLIKNDLFICNYLWMCYTFII